VNGVFKNMYILAYFVRFLNVLKKFLHLLCVLNQLNVVLSNRICFKV